MAGIALALVLAAIAVGAWITRSWLPFRVTRSNHQFASAPFSIDRASGSIRVKGSCLALQAAIPKTTFLESDLYGRTTNARYFPLQTGSGHSFQINFHDPDFEHVYLHLIFENHKLAKVTFGWGPRVTTGEWTEERIRADLVRYRAFMVQELGSTGEFAWGKAWAAKDEKAGTPTVGIAIRASPFVDGRFAEFLQLHINLDYLYVSHYHFDGIGYDLTSQYVVEHPPQKCDRHPEPQ